MRMWQRLYVNSDVGGPRVFSAAWIRGSCVTVRDSATCGAPRGWVQELRKAEFIGPARPTAPVCAEFARGSPAAFGVILTFRPPRRLASRDPARFSRGPIASGSRRDIFEYFGPPHLRRDPADVAWVLDIAGLACTQSARYLHALAAPPEPRPVRFVHAGST